jgi:trimeric autotransporter adhesin
MLRRILLTVTLLLAMPAFANAWYVTASATRSAGDTTSRVSPAGQAYLPGLSGFKNISTIAGNGFQVSRVTLDGAALCTNPASAGVPLCANSTYYPVSYAVGKTYRNLVAYFGPATISGASISVTPDSHTSYRVISPVNGSLTNITRGDSRIISIIPYAGYRVGTVTAAGCTQADSPQFAGAVDVTCANIQNALTITVGNSIISQSVTASAGPDRSVSGTGSSYAITLNGSGVYTVGPATYAWTLVSGPGTVTFGTATAATTTFSASAAGTYVVQLRVAAAGPTTATATTTVVVGNPTASKEALCTSCHSSRNAAVVTGYDGSKHKAATDQVVVCQTCHDPTNSGHYTLASPIASCTGCHAIASGTVPGHPPATDANSCLTCHDPHSLSTAASGKATPAHYNNTTTAGYPASYITSRATCNDCHVTSSTNKTTRHEWAGSGHAAGTDAPWKAYDFKTISGCVQCHTSTGFIAYSTGKVTGAWGVASDKTKELLTCIGCHRDISTGELRTVSPVKPFADDQYTNRDIGKSNICMDCHSGRNNGLSVAGLAVQNNVTSQFVAPHYLAAGGTLHGKAGYQFSGQTYAYYSTNTHRLAGTGNANATGTAGPCVACHKNSANGHTFSAGFQNGVVPVCGNCHGASLDATALAAKQSAFDNALNVLKAQLAAKGYNYSASYPYFTNKQWGAGQAGADTMGAAFNYVLLLKEPGAYAHNAAYAKRLVFDSIDYLYNGTVTGSIDGALAFLVDSRAITQTQADTLISYKNGTTCKFCHPSLSGSHSTHVGDLLESVTAYGDTGNYSTANAFRFGCGTCHPTDPALHRNGIVDVTLQPGDGAGTLRNKNAVVTAEGLNTPGSGVSGTSKTNVVCTNVYCHSNGYGDNRVYATTPNWYGGTFTGDRCAACHGNSPNTTIAGSSAHSIHVVGIHSLNVYNGVSGNLPTGGSGNVGHGIASQSTTINCNTCHANTVSYSRNDSSIVCASCHNGQGHVMTVVDKRNHVTGSVNVAFADAKVVSKAQLRPDSFVAYTSFWTRNGGNFKNGVAAFDITKDTLKAKINDGLGYGDGSNGCSNVACHLGTSVKWTDKPISYCAICHTSL